MTRSTAESYQPALGLAQELPRFVLGTLAYVVPTFALGVGWHLVLFGDVYDRLDVHRDDLIIPFGFAAMLTQGVIYSWVYPRLLGDRSVARGALLFGAGAGVLQWTLMVLAVAAGLAASGRAEHGRRREQ
ncbi:MAG: hypothetical protein AB1689_27090 [Thermodesulfobacteriota bacterium]